jgi:hypothetical protein
MELAEMATTREDTRRAVGPGSKCSNATIDLPIGNVEHLFCEKLHREKLFAHRVFTSVVKKIHFLRSAYLSEAALAGSLPPPILITMICSVTGAAPRDDDFPRPMVEGWA